MYRQVNVHTGSNVKLSNTFSFVIECKEYITKETQYTEAQREGLFNLSFLRRLLGIGNSHVTATMLKNMSQIAGTRGWEIRRLSAGYLRHVVGCRTVSLHVRIYIRCSGTSVKHSANKDVYKIRDRNFGLARVLHPFLRQHHLHSVHRQPLRGVGFLVQLGSA